MVQAVNMLIVVVTTETKSGDCVSCERVFVVDISCASRVFLRVLGFSSLNTLRVRLQIRRFLKEL